MIHSTLYLTLYTLKSMRIFSISVLYAFPMVLAREFVLQWGATLVGNLFFYSCDLNVWLRVFRCWSLLGVRGLGYCIIVSCSRSSNFYFLYQQITVPLTADELPPLPQPEGTVLIKRLKLVSVTICTNDSFIFSYYESHPCCAFCRYVLYICYVKVISS